MFCSKFNLGIIFLISSDQIRRSIFRSFYQAQQQAAFEQISAFLEQGVWFDGLFAGNDLMAFGAIEALQQRGIRVPEDVSVVGYDDIQAASYFNPKINYRPSGQAVAWPKGDRAADETNDSGTARRKRA